MANTNSKVSETITASTDEGPSRRIVSPPPAIKHPVIASPVKAQPAPVAAMTEAQKALIAAKQAARAEESKVREAKKGTSNAQTKAREVLGQGIGDLAKLCRQFINAQGADAAERTAELVRAMHGVVHSAK